MFGCLKRVRRAAPQTKRYDVMPKMKTKKAATKRFKMSATGKVLQSQGGKSHLNACKSRKRKRNLRGMCVLSEADQPRIKRMLSNYKG
jgi:large subunit ribosomal protein L35